MKRSVSSWSRPVARLGDAVLLKVIIESGELKSEALIRRAAELAIDAGADFIKTSTGKVPVITPWRQFERGCR